MQRFHLLRINLPLLAMIIFTNCTENVDRPECLPDEPTAVVRSLSDTNKSGPVTVFVDASGTMRGYVSAQAQAGVETPYANLIRTLPTLLSVPEVDQTYFAFGASTRLINRMQFLNATALPFYNNKSLNQFSRINLVFEAASSADPSGLTLVITDLFLSGNELVAGTEGPLRRPLAQALRQGKAIGILAMLSPFAGDIHDMPDNPSQPIRFRGQRPFYLVMIGPEGRITALYKRLESDVLKHLTEANYHFILFTSDMVGDLEPERLAKSTDRGTGVVQRTNVLAKGLKIPQYTVDRSVSTHHVRDGILRITVPLAPVKVPPRPGYDQEQIVVREQVYRFRRKPHSECPRSWESVRLGSVSSVEKAGTDSATVVLFKDPQILSGLPHGSVFVVDITLVTTAVKRHGDAVDWMQNWSFAASGAPQIRENPPDLFPTLNLALLADVMLDIISERYEEEPVAQIRLAFRID